MDGSKVVIVTGASSGIGRASALDWAEQGAHVVLAARGPVLLEEAREACVAAGAASATALPTDVLDREAVDHLVDDTVDRLGRVDVVVHAAMVMAYGSIEELPPETFDRVTATAIHGTANVARTVLPRFRAQHAGHLVIVTSVLGSVAVPEIGAYVAGKWGQAGLARVLALEVRDEPEVHVATVSPGAVDTPIYDRAAHVGGRPGAPPPPAARPESVAHAIRRSVERDRTRTSVGPLNGLIITGARLMAPVYDALVGPIYRRFAHASGLVGPTDGNVFTSSDSPGATVGGDRGASGDPAGSAVEAPAGVR